MRILLIAGSAIVALLFLLLWPRTQPPVVVVPSGDVEATAVQSPNVSSPIPVDAIHDEYVRALSAGCETQNDRFGDGAESAEERAARLEEILDFLAQSDSADLQHFVALVSRDEATRMSAIRRALRTTPDDPFVVFSALRLCREHAETADCDFDGLLGKVRELDGQNSAALLFIALRAFENGDTDRALKMLTAAGAASESNFYWFESVDLAMRASLAANVGDFHERAVWSHEVVSKMALFQITEGVYLCHSQSANDIEWAYACLALGKQMEQHGTDLATEFGLNMQSVVLEILGEAKQLAAVEERQTGRSRTAEDIAAVWRTVELQMTPEIYSAFRQDVMEVGVQEANVRLAANIRAALDQHPELACVER